ncbi:hypothetical protein [Marinibactrum halimedae]|uniref:VWA domain-containing protein n=1 Tax=Marinibactrum halimedae TaxID=1444977 RepID=A0AA37WNJ6_9GAMM|nr:hypothetical protein [Marinibactrum halimedae]MCD9458022.1 hypothetical protein [Marinibactrum halimedae]GLS27648.1 hypothetical protein GCM10007877_33670 [Marinibactrum halimedae]
MFLKKMLKKSAVSASVAGAVLATAMGVSMPASALDVVIILDVTGSTGALLPNWKSRMEAEVIDPIKLVDPNARFALVSHLDFPYSPYGGAGEYAYRVEATLNQDLTLFRAALKNLTNGVGGDTPESQYEAIRQANTGVGLDLNGDGDYVDLGDIPPQSLGFNPITNSFTMHFTSPLVYHNDPFEPDYPYAGVVNNPADYNDALNAMTSQNNTYFILTPDPLPTALAAMGGKMMPLVDKQTGKAVSSAALFRASSSAESLAKATGGSVLSVGSDLRGVKEAVEEIIEVVRPCPKGQVPVELPFGVVCVPQT